MYLECDIFLFYELIENLDTSIIMPFLECEYPPKTQDEYLFQCMLYSAKSTPFIKYDTEKEYIKVVRKLEKLYKKNNLDYSYINKKET